MIYDKKEATLDCDLDKHNTCSIISVITGRRHEQIHQAVILAYYLYFTTHHCEVMGIPVVEEIVI